MNIISWNVNGLRAIVKKEFFDSLQELDWDILCLQETKAQDQEVIDAVDPLSGYHYSINSAERKGYSGTAIISKTEPINTTLDMGIEEHDQEGRIICSEYEHFFLVNVYVPNAGRDLVRLDYRSRWDKDFLNFLKEKETIKPVIACGDFNVAHQPVDLKNPKSNYNKTAGYTQVEIDGMTNFLSAGFVDSFRHLYPEKVAYTYWSYRFNARAKDIGWRLDYFLVSNKLLENIEDVSIYKSHEGSDHCPVQLKLSF